MEKALEFVKQNVKITVTVVALGFALTLGYAKGCVVNVGPEAPAQIAPVAAE